MRRAALFPLAACALLIAVAPVLSQQQQQQQRRPPPPAPPGAAQQQRPLPPPGGPAQQQRGPQQPPQQAGPPPSAPPKPYTPVAIAAPKPLGDPSFDAFREQLGAIAKRKDRGALTKLVVPKEFFWLSERGDRADKKRAGVDNLSRALNLAAKDGFGWEALVGYAAEPTAMPLPGRQNTVCAPADPVFEIKQLEELAKATGTNEAEWGYPTHRSVEVRAAAQPNAPVIETLGMHFVRVMEDDGPEPPPDQPPMLRVVAPSGKVGYVPADTVSPLGNDQLCYVKDAAGWRITGFIGGDPQ